MSFNFNYECDSDVDVDLETNNLISLSDEELEAFLSEDGLTEDQCEDVFVAGLDGIPQLKDFPF